MQPDTLIQRRVKEARRGDNPTVICRVASGWVVLGDVQFLRGYSLLLPDPVVFDLNALNEQQRTTYLYEMSVVGDALLEVTSAYRINYDILCNTEQALHAHVCPRYLSEADELRAGPPWRYHLNQVNQIPFGCVSETVHSLS
jgi:diadenosine tetraphosphate (Ap4A) HIT family hydrolase